MRAIDADNFREWWLDTEGDEYIYNVSDILDALDNCKTLTSLTWWVRVDHTPPKKYEDVIVYYKNGTISIDWIGENNRFNFEYLYGRATHWMPLPEPPRKDNVASDKAPNEPRTNADRIRGMSDQYDMDRLRELAEADREGRSKT